MSVPLQTIRKIYSIKKMLVKQTEWQFTEFNQRLSLAESQLTKMKNDLQQSLHMFEEKQSAGSSVTELLEWTEWLGIQQEQIQEQIKQTNQLSAKVEEVRLLLIEKRREEEIWQNLHTKQIESMKKELQKMEQMELDEISQRNWVSRMQLK